MKLDPPRPPAPTGSSNRAAVDPDRHADCHAAVSAFVAQRIKGSEFLRSFRRDSGGDAADPGLDSLLTSIRGLCDSYSCALPTGAGYRVAEAQLRAEIRHLAKKPPARR